MPTDLSFFQSYEIYIFCGLMEFGRFAHRKHSQSDAGMNLAFSSSMELLVELLLSQTLKFEKNAFQEKLNYDFGQI